MTRWYVRPGRVIRDEQGRVLYGPRTVIDDLSKVPAAQHDRLALVEQIRQPAVEETPPELPIEAVEVAPAEPADDGPLLEEPDDIDDDDGFPLAQQDRETVEDDDG